MNVFIYKNIIFTFRSRNNKRKTFKTVKNQRAAQSFSMFQFDHGVQLKFTQFLNTF